MDWITDNWNTILLIASVVANIMVALGWKKAAVFLRTVVTGVHDYVQETGNTKVEDKIKARSVEAGTEKGLKPYVKKVKGGWISPLNEAK